MNDREVIDDEIDGLSLSEVNIVIATAASPNPRLTLLTMQVIQRARKTWHDWRGGMDADDERALRSADDEEHRDMLRSW